MRAASSRLAQRSAAGASGQKKGLAPTCSQSQFFPSYAVAPHLHQSGAQPDVVQQVLQQLQGHRARCDPHRGLSRAGPAAAAIVANAVLGPVGVVGMARSKLVGDVAVVLRALVGILNLQRQRRAGRHPLEGAGENAHEIVLAPLCGVAGLARLAPVEVRLDVRFAQGHAWRQAVDRAADGRAVALAPGHDTEGLAEGVAWHGLRLPCLWCQPWLLKPSSRSRICGAASTAIMPTVW